MPNTKFVILSDNTALCSAFTKGRSSNEFLHDIIKSVIEDSLKVGSVVEVRWINTHTMGSLADEPSRGIMPRDDFGLTSEGVSHCYSLYPSLKQFRKEGNLVSLFAGPRNNPFKVPYSSVHIDIDDPLAAKKDAFESLQSLLARGETLAGGVFCWPPPPLLSTFLHQLTKMQLAEGAEVFVMVMARAAASTLRSLSGWGICEIKPFCSAKNTSYLHKVPKCYLSLIRVVYPKM